MDCSGGASARSISTAAAAAVLGATAWWWLSRTVTTPWSTIPFAGSAAPLIGHALAFKKDPAGFLVEQSRVLGALFRVNLAGKRMVVVGSGDQTAMKCVAMASERVLSARTAVAAVGFEQTLGLYNVHHGTSFHKRVLKRFTHGAGKLEVELQALYAAVQVALATELQQAPQTKCSGSNIDDLFILVRRVVLRAVIEWLLGRGFAEQSSDDFISEFMEFQDRLEDATAKAAVLPRWLALPLVLWPVAYRRHRLSHKIASFITAASGCGPLPTEESNRKKLGPWLQAFQEQGLSAERSGELVIGLLFAAHKNPAIGAAQSYLNLMYAGTVHGQEEIAIATERAQAVAEAAMLREIPSAGTLRKCVALRRCCLETLRLTAHSIGGLRTAVAPFVVCSGNGEKEHTIWPGETIAISHIASSLDRNLWGADADLYKPWRKEWMTEINSKDVFCSGVDEYKFTTFSHGLHQCPGERIALALMQFTVAQLVNHNINLVAPLPAISFERATLAQRAGPVVVTIK